MLEHIAPLMENHVEKAIKHETETGCIQGIFGRSYFQYSYWT